MYEKMIKQKLEESSEYKKILFDQKQKISDLELEDNIDEFIRLMHDEFMIGNDKNFIDYNLIDNNR